LPDSLPAFVCSLGDSRLGGYADRRFRRTAPPAAQSFCWRRFAVATYKLAIPTLPTANLARTVAFYRDVLGFEVSVLWPDDSPAFCILIKDTVELSFTAAQPGWEPDRNVAMRLRVDDAMEIFDRIQSAIDVEWGPEVYDYGCREFSVRDCNGYSLIFSEETSDEPTCLVILGDEQ
jgi:predicted enzyme related to lactoylglutathione lyase